MTDLNLGWFAVSLDVKDIAKSLEFYRKLGFQQVDGGVELRHAALQKGDCRIGLYQGHLDPAETQLMFWQGDVRAITKALGEQGLSFERELTDEHGGSGALLRDPDGHPIYFVNLPGATRRDVDGAAPPVDTL